MGFNKNKKNAITRQSINPSLVNIRRSLSLQSQIDSRVPSDAEKIIELRRQIKEGNIDLTQLIALLQNTQTDNIRRGFRGYQIQVTSTYVLTNIIGTHTKIAFSEPLFEDVNFNTTDYNFTAPQEGFYNINCHFWGFGQTDGVDRESKAAGYPQLNIFVNGVQNVNLCIDSQQIDIICLEGSSLIYLKAGDVLDVRLYFEHSAVTSFNLIDIYSQLNINFEGCNSTETTETLDTIAPGIWNYVLDQQ